MKGRTKRVQTNNNILTKERIKLEKERQSIENELAGLARGLFNINVNGRVLEMELGAIPLYENLDKTREQLEPALAKSLTENPVGEKVLRALQKDNEYRKDMGLPQAPKGLEGLDYSINRTASKVGCGSLIAAPWLAAVGVLLLAFGLLSLFGGSNSNNSTSAAPAPASATVITSTLTLTPSRKVVYSSASGLDPKADQSSKSSKSSKSGEVISFQLQPFVDPPMSGEDVPDKSTPGAGAVTASPQAQTQTTPSAQPSVTSAASASSPSPKTGTGTGTGSNGNNNNTSATPGPVTPPASVSPSAPGGDGSSGGSGGEGERVGNPPNSAGGLNGPHGAFLAPNSLTIAALGLLNLPIVRAISQEEDVPAPSNSEGGSATISSTNTLTSTANSASPNPNSTSTPKPLAASKSLSLSWPAPFELAHYGAFPGELGNMVILSTQSSLALVRRIQLNDEITVYDRKGSAFVYRIVAFSPTGQAERTIDLNRDKWVFEPTNEAMLTIVVTPPQTQFPIGQIPGQAQGQSGQSQSAGAGQPLPLYADDRATTKRLAYRAVLAVYAPLVPTPYGTQVAVPNSAWQAPPEPTTQTKAAVVATSTPQPPGEATPAAPATQEPPPEASNTPEAGSGSGSGDDPSRTRLAGLRGRRL